MNKPILDRLPREGDEARRMRLIGAALGRYADYRDGNELEIDDDAKLSDSPDGSGTWVQAWVWIDFEQEDE